MNNEVFELHQNGEPERLPLIYRFEIDKHSTYVYLVQKLGCKLDAPILIGTVDRKNNRGWTIIGYSLAPKPITFFLSNTEFTRVNL